ncbi:pyrroloquinoline quinone biosynthesis protein PqqD [Pseudaminobacter manganicus]|uniref:Pyrroloquinoline quinone biosynthesis protein PqqD n=2 Tax=Manganibacter manganicus TaxID=1873176 RepID=A0A1V8RPH6_9HYPH|nr:pyrroloquinoline quinone biosynthesis protein PqqD [Pseudaminobacter manganicus]
MMIERQRAIVSGQSVPRLPRHVRIQFDPVRQAHAVLSPEKVFWPNEASLDILKLCDGRRTVDEITEDLARDYDASPQEMAGDVAAFLQEWADKLLVRL